jgi:hypothetical protein
MMQRLLHYYSPVHICVLLLGSRYGDFNRKRVWISHSPKRCCLHETHLDRINQASTYLRIWSTVKMGRKMRSVLLRNRKSGYTTTITPYKEDSEYWYVIETKDGDISETRRYSKSAFDLMEEK